MQVSFQGHIDRKMLRIQSPSYSKLNGVELLGLNRTRKHKSRKNKTALNTERGAIKSLKVNEF